MNEKLNTEGLILQFMESGKEYYHRDLCAALGYGSQILTTSITRLRAAGKLRCRRLSDGSHVFMLDDSAYNARGVITMQWRQHSNEEIGIESHYAWSVI